VMSDEPTKHSDQIIQWLVELGYTHCFFVAGGNIMHLLDSARTQMRCIPVVHEVAAGIAAEYFNQTATNERAFALVTAGPGLTNIVTSISGAWLEHRDLLVLGGQVKSSDVMTNGLRQRGIQEINGISLVQGITKRAIRIDKPISEPEFKEIVTDGFTPRMGPVFLEVCLDVQGAQPSKRSQKPPIQKGKPAPSVQDQADQILELMHASERPVWLLGAGLDWLTTWRHRTQLESLGFPLLTTWHGADRLSSTATNYFGRPETWGQRPANLIINQADLLVVFGARLGFQETGFNWHEYAKNAKVIQIEIDSAELEKGHPRVDLPICADANDLLQNLLTNSLPARSDWLNYVTLVRDLLPLNEAWNETRPGYVCPYEFFLEASELASDTDIWVPASSGGANSVAIQTLRQRGQQRVVCDNGLASMGYGLSGAIGASFAQPKSRVWLVEGDGGFSQNLQELATVAVNSLNIKMFVFSNDGYGSIRSTQKNYFNGDYLGCDVRTGLGFPSWKTLAAAYSVHYCRFDQLGFQSPALQSALKGPSAILVEVPIDPLQTYWPKITSRVTETGGMESSPLYQMTPELPPDIWEKVTRYL